MGHGLMLDVVM